MQSVIGTHLQPSNLTKWVNKQEIRNKYISMEDEATYMPRYIDENMEGH
jgi:ribosome biogenesis GTPase A